MCESTSLVLSTRAEWSNCGTRSSQGGTNGGNSNADCADLGAQSREQKTGDRPGWRFAGRIDSDICRNEDFPYNILEAVTNCRYSSTDANAASSSDGWGEWNRHGDGIAPMDSCIAAEGRGSLRGRGAGLASDNGEQAEMLCGAPREVLASDDWRPFTGSPARPVVPGAHRDQTL